MPRKSRPLDRRDGATRDTAIIVVACEDTHAVKQYFAKFRTRRIQYKVLETEDSRSSPRAVIERLDQYKQSFATEENDELWVCIDVDHWASGNHQRELAQVLRECRQKGYRIAISNPCFEVWLLLHYVGFSDVQSCVSGTGQTRCQPFESALRTNAGSYSKSNVTALSLNSNQVRDALSRARAHDHATGDIPDCPGSRVYLSPRHLDESRFD